MWTGKEIGLQPGWNDRIAFIYIKERANKKYPAKPESSVYTHRLYVKVNIHKTAVYLPPLPSSISLMCSWRSLATRLHLSLPQDPAVSPLWICAEGPTRLWDETAEKNKWWLDATWYKLCKRWRALTARLSAGGKNILMALIARCCAEGAYLGICREPCHSVTCRAGWFVRRLRLASLCLSASMRCPAARPFQPHFP